MLGPIVFLQAGQIVGRLLFFLFSLVFLNRFMGVEAKGAWTGMFSLFGILSVCSSMGFEVWLSRAAASGQVSGKAALGFLFRVKGVLWAICLAVGAYKVLLDDHPSSLAIPFGFALILDGIGVSQQAVFEGKKATLPMAVMSFLKSGGFSIVALTVAFLIPNPNLTLFGWLFALTLMIRVIYGWRCWNLLPKESARVDKSAYGEFLLMGAYTFVTVLYFKIDAVMLSDLVGDVATGNYGNAYDLVEGALLISAAAGSVLYPRLVTADAEQRARIFDILFQMILVIGVCGVCFIWLFGEDLGLVFAGSGFQGAVRPLLVLSLGLPFMFGNGLLSRWLFSTGREAFALKSAGALAVFNIAGNWLLIPKHGAEGAAIMTLATEGLLFFIWILVGRKSLKLATFWCLIQIPVGIVVWLKLQQTEWFISVFAGVVVLGPLLVKTLLRVHSLK